MPCKLFFEQRVLQDIPSAYYAHPVAWNEIGFGGPASPAAMCGCTSIAAIRGRPPRPTRDRNASREGESPCRMTPSTARARTAARPTCSAPAAGFRCASTRRRDGRFRRRRHGRGRRTLACRLAEARLLGGRVRCRPVLAAAGGLRLRRAASRPSSIWNDERIFDGDNPLQLGGNNSGKAVGGRTVHFAMVSLRFRPEWFKSRSAARLWRRLAARLARDVALLRRGRAGAEDLGPGELSLGAAAAALPLSRA